MRTVTLSLSLPASYRRLAGPRYGPTYAQRLFCTTVSLRLHERTAISLRVGGSGHVQLNILKSTDTSNTDPNNVLILLPSGPNLHVGRSQGHSSLNTKSLLSRLAKELPLTTIVALNYRLLPPKHPYPVPVHDAATGFSYIADPDSPHNAGRAPNISLLGFNTGGSLALVLALTSPNLVQSLTVVEPIVDWAGLDERQSRAKDSPTQNAIAHLLKLRSWLFPGPSAYFDSFASPILFLRAPGRDTPTSHSSPLAENEDDLYADTNSDADALGAYEDDMTSATDNTPPKRRKVLRRWPPIGRPEDVVLPHTRFMLREGNGLTGILRDQGREMADCMRKACFFGRERGFAEERVQTDVLPAEGAVIREIVLRVVEQSREGTG